MKALNKKEHVLFCLKYQKEEGRLKNEVEAERGMPQRKTAGKNKNTGKKNTPVTQSGTEAKH